MSLRYEKVMASQVFKDPFKKINEYSLELDKYVRSLETNIKNKHNEEKARFVEKIAKLDTLSPLKTLSRGYSITEKQGKIVNSKKDLKKDDEVELKFFDGAKQAKII